MPLTEPTRLVLAKTYVGVDDPDAAAYIAAVEAADEAASPGVGALETATKVAIHSFVKGCKADGIWPAIKASCILAGARTLSGALVPLVGTAPTNNGPFVAGDYNRKTGLVGDGSTKNLNSNRANNADPQNNQHVSIYSTAVGTPGTAAVLIGSDPVATQGSTTFYIDSFRELTTSSRSQSGFPGNTTLTVLQVGLGGLSRAGSSQYTLRFNGSNTTVTATSGTSTSTTLHVFDRGPTPPHFPSNSRLAFYSIGEALDLAKLDGRVTDLITAFGAAIP